MSPAQSQYSRQRKACHCAASQSLKEEVDCATESLPGRIMNITVTHALRWTCDGCGKPWITEPAQPTHTPGALLDLNTYGSSLSFIPED